MEIKIHTQNISLSEAQEASIHQKVEKLTRLADRLSDESSEIRIEIAYEQARKTGDSYVCTLTIFVPRDTLRAEARDESIENAVDQVTEKIKGQIEHYKSKTQHITDRTK